MSNPEKPNLSRNNIIGFWIFVVIACLFAMGYCDMYNRLPNPPQKPDYNYPQETPEEK